VGGEVQQAVVLERAGGGQLVQALLAGLRPSNLAARIRKVAVERQEAARAWLQCGNRIMVIGWSKRGKRGCRKRWTATRREVTLADLMGIMECHTNPARRQGGEERDPCP
jgi:hypothetical protein